MEGTVGRAVGEVEEEEDEEEDDDDKLKREAERYEVGYLAFRRYGFCLLGCIPETGYGRLYVPFYGWYFLDGRYGARKTLCGEISIEAALCGHQF